MKPHRPSTWFKASNCSHVIMKGLLSMPPALSQYPNQLTYMAFLPCPCPFPKQNSQQWSPISNTLKSLHLLFLSICLSKQKRSVSMESFLEELCLSYVVLIVLLLYLVVVMVEILWSKVASSLPPDVSLPLRLHHGIISNNTSLGSLKTRRWYLLTPDFFFLKQYYCPWRRRRVTLGYFNKHSCSCIKRTWVSFHVFCFLFGCNFSFVLIGFYM